MPLPLTPLTVDPEVGTFLEQLDTLLDQSMAVGVVGGTTILPGAFGVITDDDLRQRVRDGWRLAFAAMLQNFVDSGIPGDVSGGAPAVVPDPATTVVATTLFGLAQDVGTSVEYARADHSHGTPDNPVLAHVDAANPHPQYVLTVDLPTSGSSSQFTATCPVGIAVGDLVYMTGTDAVDLANTSDAPSGIVVGIVESKPTTTSCVVRTAGTVEGLSGLVAGSRYFCSSLGRPTVNCPRGSEATPALATAIGVATSATVLALSLSSPIRIRST